VQGIELPFPLYLSPVDITVIGQLIFTTPRHFLVPEVDDRLTNGFPGVTRTLWRMFQGRKRRSARKRSVWTKTKKKRRQINLTILHSESMLNYRLGTTLS
jgi:hypothetical protein